ncbi:GntR family transcriptional regulator [Ruegeria atlantica]|uniref:GntR family transcriptional regulator n=1 Tax=Ruegeria atlantica TaxID=81569 RepID=UPI00147DF330|nr:GntR family transcriptional regulator [Ruegeria atlantica]
MRKSAAEEVYGQLRQMILRGELSDGQSLKAAALQSEFGFGTTPLREALNRLSAEQLVVNSFNHGFRVAPITLDELRDLDRTRLLLETEMLVSSIRDGDEDWEGRIVASHYQLAKHRPPGLDATSEATEKWAARHQSFHEALISASGSHWMNTLLEQIETQRTRYHRYILVRAKQVAAEQPEVRDVVNEKLSKVMGIAVHTPLMEATLDREERKARDLMTEHINLTSDAYQSIQSLFPENAQNKPTPEEPSP